MSQPFLFSVIDKAVFDFDLIKPGDNILVGASGGKDSTVLIEYLAMRKKRRSADFNFTALFVQTEFGGGFPEGIKKRFDELGVDFKTIKIDVQDRLKPGRKMNCFWCSMQRRKELLHFAMENGFNKIALGHHMDDILETFLMNALFQENLAAMRVNMAYDKYPVRIIRPLCYADLKTIIAYAEENGFMGFTCTCTFQDNSARKDARRRLELLTSGDDRLKRHLMTAIKPLL